MISVRTFYYLRLITKIKDKTVKITHEFFEKSPTFFKILLGV